MSMLLNHLSPGPNQATRLSLGRGGRYQSQSRYCTRALGLGVHKTGPAEADACALGTLV
jgi:hypothetical protein